VITKVKEQEIDLWDATEKFLGLPCLGLVKPRWKAFLMGVQEASTSPIYEFEVTQQDMFNEVMGGE
jgi:hypothetical protein